MSVQVLNAGALTTVQDLGRKGYASQGIRECGACDKYAMQLANILAGNPRDCAVLELTLMGGSFLIAEDSVIAVTGADMQVCLDGKRVEMYAPVAVRAGQVLTLSAAVSGLRTYLAFHGGIDVPKVMGSRSTDVRCKTGGFLGRPLMKGDRIRIGKKDADFIKAMQNSTENNGISRDNWQMRKSDPAYVSLNGKLVPVIRVVCGPQEDYFTEEARELFVKSFYRMQTDSDRMAARFHGPALQAQKGYDIISDGIAEGSIQVSTNGQPIVMLAEHQTTGGYAKIATVISADLPAVAQCRPGEMVKFLYVDVHQAVEGARKVKSKLDRFELEFRKKWKGDY